MRLVRALMMLALFLWSTVPLAQAVPSSCLDDPCVDCGRECKGYFGEFYLCDEASIPSTACVRCAPSNCGISTNDPCCAGGSGGF